ncbi:fungal hydrophobin [Pluteus cervinus]|uniref:Fungal hydrophobin n=1 Tax=Pluteus cervinus TaxID=181527 RepID=A0ACD3AK26_9AGAR|nr:fungal hydrophobin [Pluteus cervinus]
MFSKVAFIATAVLAITVAATPVPTNQCNTGKIQCCNSVQESSSSSVTDMCSLLGIAAGEVQGLVGMNCSPMSVLAVAGNFCNSQPVCCTNNNFNGLVALGCSPINLPL